MRTWPFVTALAICVLACAARAQTGSERGAAIALFLLGLVRGEAAAGEEAQETPLAAPGRAVRYLCVQCAVLSTTPCSCATCRKGMVPAHVLAIRDGVAYCRACAADGICTPVGGAPLSCQCGKGVIKVSLWGRCVCGCGPDSPCGGFADNPGLCAGGKESTWVE